MILLKRTYLHGNLRGVRIGRKLSNITGIMYGSGDVTIDPADIKEMREYYKTLCHRLNKLDKMRKLFGNYKLQKFA